MVLNHIAISKNLVAETFRVIRLMFSPGAHICDQNDLRLDTNRPFLADSHNLRKCIYVQNCRYLAELWLIFSVGLLVKLEVVFLTKPEPIRTFDDAIPETCS